MTNCASDASEVEKYSATSSRDRSVLELIESDYTFLNERLANIMAYQFKRGLDPNFGAWLPLIVRAAASSRWEAF